jgi:RNA polymerase sigma-70 factor (ECF subfamily)
MLLDESKLIQRAQRGDRDATAALYDGCYDSVFTYIYYRVSDQECAEDLTTEVFVRMLSMLPSYVDQGRPLLAWLYTIAHNLVIDHYRNRKMEAMPLDERLVGNDGKHPAGLREDCESQEYLGRAIRQLTEEQRLVIQLKFIEDYEIGEVAAILDKNERAIRSLQHRALAALSRIIQMEHYYES